MCHLCDFFLCLGSGSNIELKGGNVQGPTLLAVQAATRSPQWQWCARETESKCSWSL